MHLKKLTLKKIHKNLFFIGLFIILSFFIETTFIFASPPATRYTPGETLNPTCGPTDTNCAVDQIYVNPTTLLYGIGTNTPSAKLEINGTVTPTGAELITNGTFTGTEVPWVLGSDAVYGTNNVVSTYTAGDPTVTSASFSTTAGDTYSLTFTISATNAPMYVYITPNPAGHSYYGPFSAGTNTIVFKASSTGTETVTFDDWNYTPGDTWTLDDVTIKQTDISPALKVVGYDGSTFLSLGGDVNFNTALGSSALSSNVSGSNNTASGYQALFSNTEGTNNTADGYQALYYNTTGTDNTAGGYLALFSNTISGYNTAYGSEALRANTTGNLNTAIGAFSLSNNSTGIANTALGFDALTSNTTGSQNVASGDSSLTQNTTGNGNTATGYYSLTSNTTGNNNTANGLRALASNTMGSSNTANGKEALVFNSTGSSNTATGDSALRSNSTGASNTANGYHSLYSNTTGSYNTANGFYSLFSNTEGIYNTANGYHSLYSNTTGTTNTANGYAALYSNTVGVDNAANGSYSLFSNTTGNFNTANGTHSLLSNTEGSFNTANGYFSLYSNTVGVENTANGNYALSANTAGSNNVASGNSAGSYLADGVTANATGGNSLFLGANTKALADAQTNQIVIGYNVIGLGSNTVVLGNDSIVTTALKGNIGIGTTAPGELLSLGLAGTTKGVLSFSGDTSGKIIIQPASVAGTYTLTLPIDDGTASQVLTTDGAGVLSWTTVGGSPQTPWASAIDAAGFTLNGNSTASGNLTLDSTSDVTKGYVLLNPTGGNVGIGTLTPTQKLDVAGNITLPTSAGNATTGIIYKGATPFIHNFSAAGTDGHNTFVGLNAGSLTFTGSWGIWLGSYNTALGESALSLLTTGADNTATGFNALHANTSGNYNTANGVNALSLITTGEWNTAMGINALQNNVGDNNSAFGAQALVNNTSGRWNVAVGFQTLSGNLGGYYNTAVGTSALAGNSGSFNSTAMGYQALNSSNAADSTAVGYQALYYITSGVNNIAVGSGAGYYAGSFVANQTSNNSVYLGYSTNASANGNTNEIVIGASAIGNGSNSVTLGNTSIIKTVLQGNVGIGTTAPTTNFQVAQGTAGVGTVSTPGSSTTLTGVGTQFTNTFKVGDTLTVSGETVRTIATITSDTVLDVTVAFSTTPRSAVAYTLTGGTRFSVLGNGNVGIGTTAPLNILHVTGTPATGTHTAQIANTLGGVTQNNGLLILAGNDTGVAASELITFRRPDTTIIGSISQTAAAAVAYNSGSDRRIKDNIVPTVYGLSDLMKINVDDFTFISDANKQKMTGFIAQELKDIYPGAVTTNGDNGTDTLAQGMTPWMIDYSKLTPLVVKAVQDLNLNIESVTGTVTPLPGSTSETFVNTFFKNIYSKVGTWLANAGNSVTDIFAGSLHAKDKLCINNTCVTEAELQALLQNSGTSASTPTPAPAPVPTPTPTPVVPTCTATQTLVNNVCTDPAPVVPICTATQTLVNNLCTDPAPVVPTCTATQTLVNNVCTDPTPIPDPTPPPAPVTP